MSEHTEILKFIIQEQDNGKRLDAFLAIHLEHLGVSRERAKGFIKNGEVLLNDKVVTSPSAKVWVNDTLQISIPSGSNEIMAEDGDVSVVYKDADMAIINKPADLTVHPCPSCPAGTLVNRLVKYFPMLGKQDNERPGIVHRLDKDTSGALLVALTERCRLILAKLFADREMHKQYLAIVHGVPKQPSGMINASIGRHPTKKVQMTVVSSGKEAQTSWQTLYADPDGRFAILGVRIFTGRTHQIRVHLTHMGHPIIGDATYAGQPREQKATGLLRASGYMPVRQMLHAAQLSFEHPFPENIPVQLPPHITRDGNVLQCFLPPPEDFMDALIVLTTPAMRVVITGLPGCGKSTLLQAFSKLGVPVSSADKVVEHLYSPGQDGWRILRSRFGERFFSSAIGQEKTSVKNMNGADNMVLDRGKLGAAMQEDPALRREVENLIHPLVEHSHKVFFEDNEQRGSSINIVEIPLFLEAGYQQKISFAAGHPLVLVGVNCPAKIRHERLMQGRGWTAEKCSFIDSWQWPEDKKMQACDMVVDNCGTAADLEPKAQNILQALTDLRKQQATRIIHDIEKNWQNLL